MQRSGAQKLAEQTEVLRKKDEALKLREEQLAAALQSTESAEAGRTEEVTHLLADLDAERRKAMLSKRSAEEVSRQHGVYGTRGARSIARSAFQRFVSKEGNNLHGTAANQRDILDKLPSHWQHFGDHTGLSSPAGACRKAPSR